MGYQTTVSSVTQSIYTVEEEAGKDAVAGLCFKHEYPQIPRMMDGLLNGPATKIHAAYRYARDKYTYGLPDGYTEPVGDASVAQIEAALTKHFKVDMELISYEIGEADDMFWAMAYSFEKYGYRASTGHLTNPPVAPVQGYNVQIESAIFDSRGNLRIKFNTGMRKVSTGPGSEVSYPVIVEKVILDAPKPDPTKWYYHIKCRNRGSDTPNYIFWMYEVGSGEYPELDFDRDEALSSPFLPIIPLREFNKPFGPKMKKKNDSPNSGYEYELDENGNRIRPDTELYKTSRKLCKYLDVDYDEIHLEVHGSPQINSIDHIYMMFGIDINTKTRSGKNYLAAFFEDAYYKNLKIGITIKDAHYRMAVNWSSITREVVQGEQNRVATLESSGNTLTIRKRIDATTYALITVTGLIHRNYVYGNHRVDTSLSASEDNEKFIVPVSYELLNSALLLDKNNVIKEGFKLVFNSYERRKMKWYESKAFQIILTVINIAIAVVTLGASLALNAALFGIQAALWAMVQQIIVGMVISYGVKWLAAQIDPNLALMLAVAAMGMGLGMDAGETVAGLTAGMFLNMGMSTLGGIQEGIQAEMEDLQKEMEEFSDYAKEEQESLEEAFEDLEVEDWFEDWTNEMANRVLYESPDDFFNRTIHTGNIGVATLSVIENYVDKQLELPELKEI